MEVLQLTSRQAVEEFRHDNSRAFLMFGDSNYNASIASYIQELQLKYPRVAFAIVYDNETPAISECFHITRLPTFIFFYDFVEVVRFASLDLNGIENQLVDLDTLGEPVEDQPQSETDMPPETPEEKVRHMRLLAARNRMKKQPAHFADAHLKHQKTHIYRIPVNGQIFTIELGGCDDNGDHSASEKELITLGRTLAELSKIHAIYVGGKVYDSRARKFATIREISKESHQSENLEIRHAEDGE